MRKLSTLGRFLLTSYLVASLASCGGKATRPVQSAAPQAETVSAEPAEAPPEKTGPDCGDGSCIRCGDDQCPKGFFCDESGSKPSCQWVPACTGAVDCGCVKKTVSDSCDCSMRDGGTYVRCKP